MKPVTQKQPRIKSKKITQSAKGESCTLRIHGVCNHNPETTIPAHINGGGMGYKTDDPLISYCCSKCHTWLDAGYLDIELSLFDDDDLKSAVRDSEQLRAIQETFPQLVNKGLVKL